MNAVVPKFNIDAFSQRLAVRRLRIPVSVSSHSSFENGFTDAESSSNRELLSNDFSLEFKANGIFYSCLVLVLDVAAAYGIVGDSSMLFSSETKLEV